MTESEIVGIVSGECGGANLKSQLQSPVLITVDVDELGKRRIGCPYLKGIMKPDNTVISYFCLAGQPPTQSLSQEFKKVTEALPEDQSAEEQWQQVISQLARKIPHCHHQDPI